MEITIGNITIGNSKPYLLSPPVEGLEKPPIRTSSGDYTGKNGGFMSAQFYSARQIVINGAIKSNTCLGHEEARKALNDLPIDEPLLVTIKHFSGNIYTTEAYIIDMKSNYEWSFTSDFQMTLYCPDPAFVIGGDYWNEAEVAKLVSGGYSTPYSLPVTWTVGSQPAIINNAGNTVVYPQIVIDGAVTNPIIRNEDTDEYISLNITTSGGQIIIDIENKTITLDGGSIINTMVSDSTWWGLVVGDNQISYNYTSGTDSAVIRWRNKVNGI